MSLKRSILNHNNSSFLNLRSTQLAYTLTQHTDFTKVLFADTRLNVISFTPIRKMQRPLRRYSQNSQVFDSSTCWKYGFHCADFQNLRSCSVYCVEVTYMSYVS